MLQSLRDRIDQEKRDYEDVLDQQHRLLKQAEQQEEHAKACAYCVTSSVVQLEAELNVVKIFANRRTILAVKATLVRTEEDLAECTAQLKGAKEALAKSEVELATAKAEKDQLELTLATQWQELTDKASQVDP